MFHVRVLLEGPIWRRQLDQLLLRYVSDSDSDIEDVPSTYDAVQKPTSESGVNTAFNPLRKISIQNKLYCCLLPFSVVLIFRTYLLLSSRSVVYFDFSGYRTWMRFILRLSVSYRVFFYCLV